MCCKRPLLPIKVCRHRHRPFASSHGFGTDIHLRNRVGTLIASQMMLNMGASQVVPTLPILATEMGLGGAGVGALLATFSATRLACNLPLGRMCDTIGRKPLMLYGTVVLAVGSLGTGLCMHQGLLPVLACRILVGAGSAASMTGSQTMMADLTDAAPRHRAQIMALQSFVLSGVWVIGPICGGMLAEGYGAQNSFYIAGICMALSSIGFSRLPETRHADRSTIAAPGWKDATTLGYVNLLASPNVLALSALSCSVSLSQSCFMTVLTLHAQNHFDASPADVGLMFSIVGGSYVVGGPVGGWLASYGAGRKMLIVPGLLLTTVAFGSLPFVDSGAHFYLLLFVSHVSYACVVPAISAFTAEAIPVEARGQTMSVIRTAADVTGMGAPLALGVLTDVTSSCAAILTTAALCASCSATFALMAKENVASQSNFPSAHTRRRE
jgi:DHA1 family multidrug resistance protein-like MFS transporter